MKQLVLLVVAFVESSVYVRQHVGVNCNSQNRQKPRERSLVVLSPVCQQSSLWLPQSDLKVRANRISPLTDLRVLRLTEDIWESQQLGNGVSQAYSSKKNAFVGAGEENGRAPIRTVEYFHFLPLQKDPWQRCHGNVIMENNLMMDAFPLEGVTAHEKEAFNLWLQSITSFCPKEAQGHPSQQSSWWSTGRTPTNTTAHYRGTCENKATSSLRTRDN